MELRHYMNIIFLLYWIVKRTLH